MSQKSLNENSVTALVIGTGPVRTIDKPRSSHVHIPLVASGSPLSWNSHARSILEITSSTSCVSAMMSLAGRSSVTAMAMMARSSTPSGPPSSPPSMSRASLLRPAEGSFSSVYISPMIRSMVVWLGISYEPPRVSSVVARASFRFSAAFREGQSSVGSLEHPSSPTSVITASRMRGALELTSLRTVDSDKM